MKQYLIFASHTYYPDGGWGDFKNSFDDEKEAIAYAEGLLSSNDESHVVDITTGTVIFRKYKNNN